MSSDEAQHKRLSLLHTTLIIAAGFYLKKNSRQYPVYTVKCALSSKQVLHYQHSRKALLYLAEFAFFIIFYISVLFYCVSTELKYYMHLYCWS